jgi:hypothetical protein
MDFIHTNENQMYSTNVDPSINYQACFADDACGRRNMQQFPITRTVGSTSM